MPEINEVLNERNKSHGDFREQFGAAQALKYVFRCYGYIENTSDAQREALDMIAHKISRVLVGDPNFKDHWLDIAGYATLIAERT